MVSRCEIIHCSFDFFLISGLLYLELHLSQHSSEISCSPPMKTWLAIAYLNIIAARVFFFLFEVHNQKLMRISAIAILFFLAPFHLLWTILGTNWYLKMIRTDITCVTKDIQIITIYSIKRQQYPNWHYSHCACLTFFCSFTPCSIAHLECAM